MEKYKRNLIYSIILICLVASVFVVGYTMPEIYEAEEGESHAWGLKFMPPCKPFGSNVTCGYDMLLLFPLAIAFAYIMVSFDSYFENRRKDKQKREVIGG